MSNLVVGPTLMSLNKKKKKEGQLENLYFAILVYVNMTKITRWGTFVNLAYLKQALSRCISVPPLETLEQKYK